MASKAGKQFAAFVWKAIGFGKGVLQLVGELIRPSNCSASSPSLESPPGIWGEKARDHFVLSRQFADAVHVGGLGNEVRGEQYLTIFRRSAKWAPCALALHFTLQ